MSDMVVRIAADLTKFRENFKLVDNQVDTTSSALSRMTSAFDGSRTIANANAAVIAVDKLGGATKFTTDEQARLNKILTEGIEQYAKLGREAPATMLALAQSTASAAAPTQTFTSHAEGAFASVSKLAGSLGIGLSIGALVSFGKSTLDAASNIGDLSSKLGISTEAVQRFIYVAGQSGTTISAFEAAITKMNQKLSAGEESTIESLKKAGLAFDAIRSLKPEDAFTAIAEAIQRVPDPMLQTQLAIELLGKSAADLLPAIKEGIKQIGDQASIMGAETVRELKRAQDQWETWSNSITVGSANAIAGALKSADAAKAATSSWSNFFSTLAAGFTGGSTGAILFASALTSSAEAGKNFGDIALTAANNVKPLTEEQMRAAEAAKAAAEKHAEAIATLATFSQDYRATLAGINTETVTEVQGFMAAGASLTTLQEAYRLTEGQIRAISIARQRDIELSRDQNKANEDLVKADAQALAAATKLWSEYHALRVANSGTATDQQIADINRWSAETAAAFEANKNRAQMSAQAVADFYDALTTDTTAKLNRVGVDWKSLTDAATNDSQRGLQQIADAAKQTYDIALGHTGEWSDATVEKFRATWEAAQRAADNWSSSTVASIAQVDAKSTAAAQRVALSWQQAMDLVNKGQGTMGGSVSPNTDFSTDKRREIQKAYDEHRYYGPVLPGGGSGGGGGPDWEKLGFGKAEARANGGPVDAGSPYMVGERGPELFVPARSGSIVPNGASPAGMQLTLHTTVTVGGSVVGMDDIGRAVDEAIVSSMRRSGITLPVAG